MRHEGVAAFVDALSAVFESRVTPDPKPKLVAAAGKVLSRLATRSVSRTSSRTYGVIMLDGSVEPLLDRVDALDDAGVQQLLERLRTHDGNARDHAFERAYFEHRLGLA